MAVQYETDSDFRFDMAEVVDRMNRMESIIQSLHLDWYVGFLRAHADAQKRQQCGFGNNNDGIILY